VSTMTMLALMLGRASAISWAVVLTQERFVSRWSVRLSHQVAEPVSWGSQSASRTDVWCAQYEARATAAVVLPVPPFEEIMAICIPEILVSVETLCLVTLGCYVVQGRVVYRCL